MRGKGFSGELGWLDPITGKTKHIPLGKNSTPDGVIVGPDGALWITDSSLNAIVRFDPKSEQFKVIPQPSRGSAVRQILERPGEVWLPLLGVDKLAVIRE